MDFDEGVSIELFEMPHELTEEGWGCWPDVLAGLPTQFAQSVLGLASRSFELLNALNVFKCQ